MQAMVIAQDLDEREMLALILRRAGLAVASGANLERVMQTWSDHPADLIVLALAEGQPASCLCSLPRPASMDLLLRGRVWAPRSQR
jgi:hypothetical protein